VDSFPHPQIDMKNFLNELEKVNALTPKAYNTVTQKLDFWVNRSQLSKSYSKSKCVIC
jgi:succinate dehydrogenase/fumarate reductase-like Fe-S protein